MPENAFMKRKKQATPCRLLFFNLTGYKASPLAGYSSCFIYWRLWSRHGRFVVFLTKGILKPGAFPKSFNFIKSRNRVRWLRSFYSFFSEKEKLIPTVHIYGRACCLTSFLFGRHKKGSFRTEGGNVLKEPESVRMQCGRSANAGRLILANLPDHASIGESLALLFWLWMRIKATKVDQIQRSVRSPN